MSDPNIVGHVELTCGNCGFRGSPIVAAAHDCIQVMAEPIHGQECYEAWREYRPCPHESARATDDEET